MPTISIFDCLVLDDSTRFLLKYLNDCGVAWLRWGERPGQFRVRVGSVSIGITFAVGDEKSPPPADKLLIIIRIIGTSLFFDLLIRQECKPDPLLYFFFSDSIFFLHSYGCNSIFSLDKDIL
jgi:hypothetical protein